MEITGQLDWLDTIACGIVYIDSHLHDLIQSQSWNHSVFVKVFVIIIIIIII